MPPPPPFFCITGFCFTLKREHCSVTGYTYWYNFFLGFQLQLQICLLGVGKMNDFMMFVTECTKENQNWALGRQFIIVNLRRWEKPKRCMKVTVFGLSGVVVIWFWTSIVRCKAPGSPYSCLWQTQTLEMWGIPYCDLDATLTCWVLCQPLSAARLSLSRGIKMV